MIKEVIFDIDDTLYDYEVGHAQGMKKMGSMRRRSWASTQESFWRPIRDSTVRLQSGWGGTTPRFTAGASVCRICWSSCKSRCFRI